MMQPIRPPATPVIPKPRVIGPCYRCAGWGHLAASCTKAKATYPLNQPVVGLADPLANIDACVLNVDSSTVACSAEESGKSKGVDSNLDKGTDVNNKVVEGVNTCKAYGSNPESFDVECTIYSRDVDLEDAWYSMEAPKYWELDSTDAHQIIDVQGRLK